MRNEKRKQVIKWFLFLFPILLILFYWKNTIANIATHLYDWHDVPFVIWIFQNNIKSIGLFDLIYHHETNAMYPFPFSLSFTEHMYFPSYIVYFMSWFIKNPILQFNILAILNHILVYLSSYLLAGRFSRNYWVKTIVGFFIAFSPYMFLQSGHFQMVFFWPLIMGLYFLFHPSRQLQHLIFASVFFAWQFMSSVYIGIMGGAIVAIYYILRLALPGLFPFIKLSKKELEKQGKAFFFGFYSKWDERGLNDKLRVLGEIAIILVISLILCEPTLEAYFEMQNAYKPVIEQGQYVNYAAHITDYLFPSGQSSLLYRLFGFWRGLNGHRSGELAAFIGFAPIVLLFLFIPDLKRILFNNKTKHDYRWLFIWAFALIAIAFIFSLGPRFNFNGKYLVFPLPYLVILKTVPFIGVMRALARWYLVITLAVAMLLMPALEKWGVTNGKSKKYLLPLIFVFFIIEFYPAPQQASLVNWQTKPYATVREVCKEDPQPMLEYPFDYRAKDASISKDLTYKNTILLASTTHSCDILSGFTAYTPKKYIEYRDFLQNKDFNRGGLKLLYDLGFRYVKFNLSAMNQKEKAQITKFLRLRYSTKLYEDKETIIIRLRQLSKYEMIETIR